MKTGKNIFAKVTLLNKGQDEPPNRKLGKGSGVNGKFTRGNANAKNFTFTNNKENKTNQRNMILHLSDWQTMTKVSYSAEA